MGQIPIGDKNDPMRNGEGYLDVVAGSTVKKETEQEKTRRFKRLLATIFYICDLAGYELANRIVLVDKKTGKRWE